jgi:hypothetical protein
MATIFGGNEGLSGALAPHTARMRQISLAAPMPPSYFIARKRAPARPGALCLFTCST